MKVVFHIGMHCTDNDSLLRCLLKNRDALAQEGIIVPGPGRYRPLLQEALRKLRGAPADLETQEVILDAVVSEDAPQRLVLSWESFLCAPDKAVGGGALYPMAGEKSKWLPQVFPGSDCEFHVAIRNPATFLPALFEKAPKADYAAVMDGADPRAMRWSTVIAQIRDNNPAIPLTVWCDEDTPLIWPEVLRHVSGHSEKVELAHVHDRLAGIMAPAGLEKMRSYLETQPYETEDQRRRIVSAFLDKYVLDEAVEIELDLPGWTVDVVDEMTGLYEEDVHRIAHIDGVRFIAP